MQNRPGALPDGVSLHFENVHTCVRYSIVYLGGGHSQCHFITISPLLDNLRAEAEKASSGVYPGLSLPNRQIGNKVEGANKAFLVWLNSGGFLERKDRN